MSEASFDRLVRLHRMPLERYVCRLGASREDAEEIAASALLRAYQEPPSSTQEREWHAWLRTVARNLHIDARRRRQLRLVGGEGVLEAIPTASAPVDQIAATAQEARQICAAIALLPPTPRAAIYLREVRGLSYEEISAELGITQRAVTTTLERARAILKERRSGLVHALCAVSCSPLALVRRGARVLQPAFSAAATKFTVPVLLAVTAGGGTLVAHQHPWATSPAHAPAAAHAAVAAAGANAVTSRGPARSGGMPAAMTRRRQQTPLAPEMLAATADGAGGTQPGSRSDQARDSQPPAVVSEPQSFAHPLSPPSTPQAAPPRVKANAHTNAHAKSAAVSRGAKGAQVAQAAHARNVAARHGAKQTEAGEARNAAPNARSASGHALDRHATTPAAERASSASTPPAHATGSTGSAPHPAVARPATSATQATSDEHAPAATDAQGTAYPGKDPTAPSAPATSTQPAETVPRGDGADAHAAPAQGPGNQAPLGSGGTPA